MSDFIIQNEDIHKYLKRIHQLSSRKCNGAFQELCTSQRILYNAAKNTSTEQLSVDVSRSIIEKEFYNLCSLENVKKDFNCRDNVITDYCFNMVNIEDNQNKFLICTGKGIFHFKDFSWLCPDGVPITWNVRNKWKSTVGEYKNGEYFWDFTEIEALISMSREGLG